MSWCNQPFVHSFRSSSFFSFQLTTYKLWLFSGHQSHFTRIPFFPESIIEMYISNFWRPFGDWSINAYLSCIFSVNSFLHPWLYFIALSIQYIIMCYFIMFSGIANNVQFMNFFMCYYLLGVFLYYVNNRRKCCFSFILCHICVISQNTSNLVYFTVLFLLDNILDACVIVYFNKEFALQKMVDLCIIYSDDCALWFDHYVEHLKTAVHDLSVFAVDDAVLSTGNSVNEALENMVGAHVLVIIASPGIIH